MPLDLASAQVATTAVLNLSLAAVTGACMSDAWLRTGKSPWAMRNAGRLRTFTLASVTAALISFGVLLCLEAAAMAEVPLSEVAPAVSSVLHATHYGFAWKFGIVSLTVIAVASAVCWPPPFAPYGAVLRFAAIGSFLYSRSIVSHAGAAGDFTLAVAADWTHLVLISVWVGEVLVAGFITLRKASDTSTLDKLERANHIQALSNSATIALAGIFMTGLIAAWRGLGSLDNVSGNPYASVLLLKVALVLGAAALGGANRFLVMPRLLAALRGKGDAGVHHQRRFALILQVEAFVLVAVLILAAILSSTSPPAAG